MTTLTTCLSIEGSSIGPSYSTRQGDKEATPTSLFDLVSEVGRLRGMMQSAFGFIGMLTSDVERWHDIFDASLEVLQQ